MDDQSRPHHQGEPRTYRFISDRFHKENLSGRVRAACITCRRRKVKCEGVEPCRTCNEKGLVCEGLPRRKRSDCRISPISTPTASETRGTERPSQDALRRPGVEALHKDHISEDSGYESFKMPRSQPASPVDMTLSTEDQATFPKQQYPSSGFSFVSETFNYGHSSSTRGHSRSFDEATKQASASSSRGPPKISSTSNPGRSRSKDQESVSLMTTARALEEQARSLRLLATQHVSWRVDDQKGPHSGTEHAASFGTLRSSQQPADFHQPFAGDMNNVFSDQSQELDFNGLPEPNSPEWWSLYHDAAQQPSGMGIVGSGAGYQSIDPSHPFGTHFMNDSPVDHQHAWQFLRSDHRR